MNYRQLTLAALIWTLGANAQTQKPSQDSPDAATTPAMRMKRLAAEHPTTEGFVAALEDRLASTAKADRTDLALHSMGQILNSSGAFTLTHPLISGLGSAYDSQDMARVRAELAKLSHKAVIQDFSAQLTQQIQAAGGVRQFSKDLGKTLKGSEHPLLAFAIYLMFAT